MADIPGFLQTIAEIGVAIAGFSGLIVTLRRDAGPLTSVQKYRLQVLLSLAFGAMFLSLLPELLVYFGAREARLWRIANLVLLGYSLTFLTWWLAATLRIKTIDSAIFNWIAFSRMAAGHIVVVLALLAFLIPAFGFDGPATFSAGLIWYLLHSVQQFTRMLFIRARSDVA